MLELHLAVHSRVSIREHEPYLMSYVVRQRQQDLFLDVGSFVHSAQSPMNNATVASSFTIKA